MIKQSLAALLVCLAFLVRPAHAQENMPTIANLEVSLWPEFDRPEVLVIYRGLFAADTPLPLPVEIRIPASAGQPSAVAYVGEGGQRFNQEHTIRAEGDWLVVSFELATLGFQLEYYAPLPVDAEGQRQFSYLYTADYAVSAFSLEVQVPPTAQAFMLDPPADSIVQETDGLTYHLAAASSLTQGETRSWTVTYQKADSNLTVESFVSTGTPSQVSTPTAKGKDNSTVLIFALAFVALVAVGGGAFWLGKQTQSAPQATSQPRRKSKWWGSRRGSRSQEQRFPPSGDEKVLFCYRCGAQLRPDSRFCHECGAAVRDM